MTAEAVKYPGEKRKREKERERECERERKRRKKNPLPDARMYDDIQSDSVASKRRQMLKMPDVLKTNTGQLTSVMHDSLH